MELFDFVKTNTHTHDLETSRDAARATEGRARKIRSVLRKALRKAGCPLSAEQLSDWTRIDSLTVSRRLSDLRRDHEIADSGERHRNRSGSPAARWELTGHFEAASKVATRTELLAQIDDLNARLLIAERLIGARVTYGDFREAP